MNHYTLRTVSGAEYSFDGQSITEFMMVSSSLGDIFVINMGNATITIRESTVESITEARIPEKWDEWANVDIDCLDLSVRSFNCLRRAGIDTVKDILVYMEKHGKLSGIRNIGPSSQCEIYKKLKSQYGLDMRTGEVTDDTDT